MSIELEEAKSLLAKGGYTCVIARDKDVLTSKDAGVKPLLDWLSASINLQSASAADKVVGKAPALLYVLLGVSEVYGTVMSEAAVEVLTTHGIEASYDTLVPFIENKMRTGMCPIEQSVVEVEEPEAALGAIRRRLAELRAAK